MIEAPKPDNEVQRLQALRKLLILDTPPEERFDRIVAFAAEEFETKMALVSMLDADRQWFKAKVGMDDAETPRATAFCSHTILQDTPLVVPDATLDARFSGNPNVTGDAHVRFYAGMPLTLPTGENVGTLCLVDEKPGNMDAVGLAILQSLRDLVVEELVRREQEDQE